MSKAFTSEETPELEVTGRVVQRVARGQERPITPGGFRALEAEQRELVEQALPSARASGEEGARARLEHRLAVVAAVLESVRVVVPPPPDGTVRFGSEVELRWEDGRRQVVTMVGPDEADSRTGRVAFDSPLGRALDGARVGEAVELERPRGVARATVTRVA